MADGHLQELRHHPLVFVDDLGAPELSDHDLRHLTKSLRLRSGERLAVGDGAGRLLWARLSSDGDLEPDGEAVTTRRPMELTVAFAVVKGDRSELVVQKATELGISRIVPLHTARTVVKWGPEKAAKNLQRHLRIAREASMQSRRLWLPVVTPVMALDQLFGDHPDAVLAEPGGAVIGGPSPPTCIAVGPEGGFSADELAGRPTVGLPGNILRSETAAIAAAVLLQAQPAA